MENEIDSLVLNIEVQGKGSGKEVKALATAISSLNTAIEDSKLDKISQYFHNLSKSIAPIATQLKGVSSELKAFANVSKTLKNTTKDIPALDTSEQAISIKGEKQPTGTKTSPESTNGDLDKTKNQWSAIVDVLDKAFNNVGSLTFQLKIAQSNLNSLLSELQKTPEGTERFKELQVEISKAAKEVERLKKELENAKGQNSKLGKSLNKTIASFARIGFYRIVRTLLKELTTGISDAFKNISKASGDFNNTLSSVTSSITILKQSVGLMVASVLPAVEPILRAVSIALGAVANSMSKISALIRGQSYYMKINTDYWKDYKSQIQGTLLAFDTFTTLSVSGNTGLFKKEDLDLSGNVLSNLSSVEILLVSIGAILTSFGAIKIVKWIFADGLIKVFKSLKNIAELKFTSITVLVAGIAILATGIAELVKNWNNVNFEAWEKAITIVTALVAGVVGLVVAIKALKMPIAMAIGLGAALTGSILWLGSSLATKTKAFANGGMFEGAGTMYALAGESGAEVVATGSAGTGVLNVDQFADAMVSALVRYGAARDTSNGTTIVLDGNKVGQLVASNVGFRNEANRRNAGLNWK